jgi:hypothetical protein
MRSLLLGTATFVLLSLSGASAQTVVTQPPCSGDVSGVCATIDNSDLSQRTLRSIIFTAPGPGLG